MENLTRMDTFYTLQGTAAEIQTKSVSEKCQSRHVEQEEWAEGVTVPFFPKYQTINVHCQANKLVPLFTRFLSGTPKYTLVLSHLIKKHEQLLELYRMYEG